MLNLYHASQLVGAIAFGLVGAAALLDWARYRGRARAALGIALGSLGLVSLLGQVTTYEPGWATPLSFLTIPLFLASGYGLLLFRNELLPYPRLVFRGASALVALTLVVFLVAIALAGPQPQQQQQAASVSKGLVIALLLLLVVWGVCVVEPAISLAIASRGRPAVQRARVRSLSLAYGTIVLVLVVDIVIASVTGFKSNSNLGVQLATELIVLATAPLMYFSFKPPSFLRRVWRSREEEPLRHSLQTLLLATKDRSELAGNALGWAVRLVGAEAGLIADGTRVLASSGLTPERAEQLRVEAEGREGSGPLPAAGSGEAYRFQLALAEGTGSVVLVSGPFTPLLGGDESGRMEEYAVAVAAALDRARLVEELRQNQALLERRVAERTADLEAANKELEAFSYTVSHDLRQPLRALDGFSQALIEELPGEVLEKQSLHYLDAISRNAKQMGHLIDSMLNFSRLSRQPIERRRVAPRAIAQRLADDWLETADGHRPQVTVADLPDCYADPTLLEQVFSNLIGNAFKFSAKADQPAVEIGYQAGPDGEVTYFVRDNGAGFDMKYKDKLFGVFQRLHSSREYEGSGAGLAIVQRIVHRHGGRVWAEGEVGKGATFYFTVQGGQ